jgi:hypothetical protein
MLKHWNINEFQKKKGLKHQKLILMNFWKSNGHHFDTKDTSGRSQKLAVPKRGRGQLLLYRRFKVPPAAPAPSVDSTGDSSGVIADHCYLVADTAAKSENEDHRTNGFPDFNGKLPMKIGRSSAHGELRFI